MRILAIGDSVPAGAATRSDPFPERAGAVLSARLGVPVQVANLAVNGVLVPAVRTQLHLHGRTRRAAREADVVVITAGANDLAVLWWLASCGLRLPGRFAVPASARHVAGLARQVQRVNPAALVYVCTYWNVFADGRRERRDVRRAWSRKVTGDFNRALRARAADRGCRVLDLATAFRDACGPDPTPLLAVDGEHPNSRGHQVIAEGLAAQILRDWQRPARPPGSP